MLTEEDHRKAAEAILKAERERVPCPQLSKTFPNMEIADAYRVQDLWAEARIAPKPYAAGSWGPSGAFALIERFGKAWSD